MSQKKMDAYKNAKKNKKQIEKKQKLNIILAWIGGILIAAALIGGSVYLVYYTQQQASPAATDTSDATAQDVADILQESLGDDGNYTITTEPIEETETEAETETETADTETETADTAETTEAAE